VNEYVIEWDAFWDYKEYIPNPDIMDDSGLDEVLMNSGDRNE